MEPDRLEHLFRLFCCGGLTLFFAWVLVRDLRVGVTFGDDNSGGGSVAYTRADNPIRYSVEIIVKIVAMIFFGVGTLYLTGFIATNPLLILKQALPPVIQQLLAW